MEASTPRQGMLNDRLLEYAVRIIKVSRALPNSVVGAHVNRQMVRSGTAAGANYQEACGAESRRDFIHKMQIVLKELRETDYWLKVVAKIHMLPPRRLSGVLRESDELIAMVVQSILTARKKGREG